MIARGKTIAVPDLVSTSPAPEVPDVRLNIAESRGELKGFQECYTLKMQPYLVKWRERQKAARKRLWTYGPLGTPITDVADRRHVEVLVNEICRVFDIVDTLQLCLKTSI